ncbi:MAG: ATP-dependent DNA helicase RecQ, partial [Muribaculaceae bacterium]|nr:ATP-dependent DNA helicase RecQ [Muribaculaceae bacterium]
DRKVSLDALAESQNVSFDELLDDIEAIVYSGTRININYYIDSLMDEEHQEDIFDYFRESETDDLEEAIKELGNDYTPEEIRLVRIKFLSEMGN